MGERTRNDWEALSLSDLNHLNQYSKNKLISSGYPIPFCALNVHWVEPIGPSIPDGR